MADDPTYPQSVDPATVPASDPQPVAAPADGTAVTPDPSPAPSPLTSSDSSDATSGDPTPAPASAAAPVPMIYGVQRRSDEDALLGSWVDVVGGEYQGRFGAFVSTVEHDAQTGYPLLVLVRTRDADNLLIEVAYQDIRPSARNGGR